MKLLRLLAVSALVAGIVVAPMPAMAAAGAASAQIMPAASDDNPAAGVRQTRWKAYWLNTLGSVLGAAMPDSWRREQLAMNNRYNHSWEGLAVQFGTDPANPNYSGRPDSYEDYILKKTEQDLKGGTGGKPMTAPATKADKFGKIIGGVTMAPLAYDFGTMIGKTGLGLFGYDSTGAVCSATQPRGEAVDPDQQAGNTKWLEGLMGMITGADCDAWHYANDYGANQDAALGDWEAGETCVRNKTTGQSVCVRMELKRTGSFLGCDLYFYRAAAPEYLYTTISWIGANGKQASATRRTEMPGGSFAGISGANEWLCNGWSNGNYPLAGFDWWVDDKQLPSTLEVTAETATADKPASLQREREDPERILECAITYQDGTSAVYQSAKYRESGGKMEPSCSGEVTWPNGKPDPNSPATDVAIREKQNPGTEEEVEQVIWEEETTPEWREWYEQYPECTTGACKLDLKRTGGAGVPLISCFDLEEGCVDWWEKRDSGEYVCTYGIHEVSIEECAPYAGLFQPGRIEVGAPYTDPITGEWSGGQNGPRPDQDSMGQQIGNPEVRRSCNGTNVTSFDPIGFVMRPVQCALEWAFVARPTVVAASVAGSEKAWEGKPPAVIAEAAESWQLAPSAQGCAVSVEIFSGEFRNPVTPIDNCAGSWMEPVTNISRIVTSAGMVILVAVVLRRQIAGMAGYSTGQG